MCSIFNIDCSSFKNGCKKRMKRSLKKQMVFLLFFTGEKPFNFFSSLFLTLAESLECNIHLYNFQ